jgi:hypothetical protein
MKERTAQRKDVEYEGRMGESEEEDQKERKARNRRKIKKDGKIYTLQTQGYTNSCAGQIIIHELVCTALVPMYKEARQRIAIFCTHIHFLLANLTPLNLR